MNRPTSTLKAFTLLVIGFMTFSCAAQHIQDDIIEKTNDSSKVIGIDRFAEANLVIQQKCLSCHGVGSPDGDFESLKTETDWIRSGRVVPGNPTASSLFLRLISSIRPMPPSGNLKPQAIVTIRSWINVASLSADDSSKESKQAGIVRRPRLMNRAYVVSVLKSVFDDSSSFDIISGDEIAFGGACDSYNEKDCEFSSTKIRKMTSIPDLSPMRQGLVKKVCRELVDETQTLNAAISKATGASLPDRITTAYQLFFPGQNLPDDVLGHPVVTSGSLVSLYEIAKTLETNPALEDRAGMKAIFYALCQAPEWHIP